MEEFLPPAGRGRVLITSQNQIWPPGQALDVPVLDTEVAADFLVSRTGDPDGQAARDLAAELGGLPLALEQAAAYIQATGDSLAGYLALFRQRRADMLARGEPTGYGETVATTWALAFARLEQAAPGGGRAAAAAGVLRARGDPAAPAAAAPPGARRAARRRRWRQVLAPLLEDALAAEDAIAALRRYSLVTPAGDGLVLGAPAGAGRHR